MTAETTEPTPTAAAPGEAAPEAKLPVAEFHREIANELFNQVLNMLQSKERNCAENDRMIHAAHASRFHWEFGGTVTNVALGEWQCARVHTVLRQTESALHHAWRYLELAENYGLGPFHLAHAHLCVAAALALKRPEEVARQVGLARELFPHVAEEEERALLQREAEAIESPEAEKAAAGAASGSCCG
jgi:hypothetical protein